LGEAGGRPTFHLNSWGDVNVASIPMRECEWVLSGDGNFSSCMSSWHGDSSGGFQRAA
jgi:hypothetical protein